MSLKDIVAKPFSIILIILLIIIFLCIIGLSIAYLAYVAYIKRMGGLSEDEKKVFLHPEYFGTGFGVMIAVIIINYFIPLFILKFILILLSICCLSIIAFEHNKFNDEIKENENSNLKEYKKKYNNISIWTMITFAISAILRFISISL